MIPYLYSKEFPWVLHAIAKQLNKVLDGGPFTILKYSVTPFKKQ